MINKDLDTLENLLGFLNLDIINLDYAISFLEKKDYEEDKTLLQLQKKEAIDRLMLVYMDLKRNYDENQGYIEKRYKEIKDDNSKI